MAGFVAGMATYVVALMLVAGAAGHLRRPDDLPAALRAHGVVPAPAVATAARAVTFVELGLAVALLAGLTGSTGLLVAGLSGAGVLFAGYGGYGWFVVATGRGGPCGCGTAATPMSGWVAGRALALAALAGIGAASSGSDVILLTGAGARLALVLLAAGTFAALLWALPAAMRDPDLLRSSRQREPEGLR